MEWNGYRPYMDGIFFGVDAVSYKPDGETVFRTFTDAKKKLLRELRSRRNEYNLAIAMAARLTTRDVEDVVGEEPRRNIRLLPIVRAAAQAQNAKTTLHKAIRLAHVEGYSLREIAQAAGMSHEQVRRIVSEK